jgi:SAM-dependent methyltransferase
MAEPTFDPSWESAYRSGHAQRYPWDVIVSFVFKNAPRDRPPHQVRILEVGCGTASNLWFAAREGFEVLGIDGSASAIEQAKARFEQDGLTGDLRVGDFTQLPFPDGSVDLAIDRGALVCTGRTAARTAIGEIHRVLKRGSRFFFNPFSDRHSSSESGTSTPDGLRLGITEGTLVGVGQLCFYGKADVHAVLGNGWQILSLQHMEWMEVQKPEVTIHAEWRVVAEKL